MTLVSALACTLVTGCIVEERHYDPPPGADTEIELEESVNIGQCGDASIFSWTATLRETGDSATATCSQPIVFQNLTPNVFYTIDVAGYQGSKLCWQGSCGVDTRYGVVTYADCSEQITHLCGY